MVNIVDIYKDEHILDAPRGVIMINYEKEEPSCIMEYNADTKKAHIQFFIYADSLENAQNMYDSLLPEIRRKEKIYKATGKCDHINNQV